MARDHRVEVELKHTLQRARPVPEAAARGVIDHGSVGSVEREQVARYHEPFRGKMHDDIAVSMTATEMMQIDR